MINKNFIKINEIFYDIEGEGKYTGNPTLFIRVTGCNLRCKWCDTKYAYYKGKNKSINELVKIIKNSPFKYVNITGGEPLLYKEQIKKILKKIKNKYITIETNGSILINDIKVHNISMDLKLPSSGENEKMILSNLKYLKEKDQVKLVVANKKDLIFAKRLFKKYTTRAEIIVQPVYKKFSIKKIKKFILKNKLNWRLGIQLHKLTNY